MRFKSYWRTTVVAAIFLHFFVWLGLALALPLLDFEGDPLAVQVAEPCLPHRSSSPLPPASATLPPPRPTQRLPSATSPSE